MTRLWEHHLSPAKECIEIQCEKKSELWLEHACGLTFGDDLKYVLLVMG